MACELSGLNGKLPAGCKVKKVKELFHEVDPVRKWRRRLLWFLVLCAVLVGVLWLLLSANKGASGRREKGMSSCEEKIQLLMQYFNVSAENLCDLASFCSKFDQIPSPEHAKVPGLEMPMADGIVCAPRVVQSKKRESELQDMMMAEDLESDGQCPMQEEHASVKLQPLLQDKLVTVKSQLTIPSTCQHCAKDFLQSSESKPCEEDYCGTLNLSFVKVCWCILGGMMAYCMFSCFIMTFWQTEKLKAAPIEPVPLQRQQLLQMKQQQLTQSPPKSAGKWRKKFLVLFVFAGIVVSIWLFQYFNGQHVMSIEETLANMCDERARMLQDQFNVSMNHVKALAILVSTFHHGKDPSVIDQVTFCRYTERTAFERPLTSGVAYALKVLHSDREQFEKQQGWTIKKMEFEDQSLVQHCVPEELDPAPVRDEYAPVIFSQETVSHIISIDMMSGQEDRENILRARASGKGVLTSPFKLLKSNNLGVVLTFAVYNTDFPLDTSEQRIEAAVGYLGASYDIPSLVDKLLQQLASKQTIVVHVYDTTNASAPILMYRSDVPDAGLLHISNLDFGDPMRKHEMHCRFKQKPPLPWTAIMASIGNLTIILLVGYIFHAALERIAKVEADCRKMMELKGRAEAADVAKSQFLATVSHEIRTPMNGVLGMLKMLMDTDLDTNQMDYAWTAHNSGKELISLINDVLDQAKIESGRLELETVPFDLPSVLDRVLSIFSAKANDKGIELAVYVSNQVPEVVIGDPVRFRQIIQNLVGNSIKFTRKNEGHIFVTVHLTEEVINQVNTSDVVLKAGLSSMDKSSNEQCATLSGFPVVSRWKSWENFKRLNNIGTNNESEMVRVLVTVEDTGVGISQEAQGRIFTPFVQGDSSTSRTYGGTGIGLSISKSLVDLMDGEIGFVSEPNIGSTFSFTVSFRRGELSSFDAAKWDSLDPEMLQIRGRRAVIVDNRNIRAEVTRYHLNRLGVSADIASSLTSACTYISTGCLASAPADLAAILIDQEVWDKEAGTVFDNMLKESMQNGVAEIPLNLPKVFLLATSIKAEERWIEIKSARLVDNVVMKPLRLSVLIAGFQEALGAGRKIQVNKKKPLVLQNLVRGKQILVVDDNMVNRRVAEGALKKYGASVTCVNSGTAAVKLLKPPHKFDACFMDRHMPEMDGLEATQKIRSMEKLINDQISSGEASIEKFGNVAYWHTPILAMTADVIQGTNEECLKCGMDDYISKPFEEEQLYNALARFFDSG